MSQIDEGDVTCFGKISFDKLVCFGLELISLLAESILIKTSTTKFDILNFGYLLKFHNEKNKMSSIKNF